MINVYLFMELMTGELMANAQGLGRETHKERNEEYSGILLAAIMLNTLPGWPTVPSPHYSLFLWLQVSHSTWKLQNVTNNIHLIQTLLLIERRNIWDIYW